MTAMIEVRALTKNFGQHEVLKGVNFQVDSGEIIALLGKNGAGKSTLIHLLNGLTAPSSGDIRIFQRQPHEAWVKNRTGMMFQENMILQHLTVKEMLDLGRSYYQDPLALHELLQIGQLQEIQDQFVSDLSGGQQRRVNLALALAGDPDVIFLDEPTNSMDSHSRQEFWKVIYHLKEQGKTMIVTSHYLEELEDMATRILILSQGVIAFDGSLGQLRRDFGQSTISFTSDLDSTILDALPGNCLSQVNQQITFTTMDEKEFVRALIPYLDKIENLAIHPTSLTTIYHQFEKEVSHDDSSMDTSEMASQAAHSTGY